MDPRILPFAAYMAFVALAAGLAWLTDHGLLPSSGLHQWELWLYPIKTAIVATLLTVFWSRYDELKDGAWSNRTHLVEALVLGLVVYVAWVRMDWGWATQGGTPRGYDPSDAGSSAPLLIAIRLFGASLVVPVMEELFWRSFLIRYIDDSDYLTVRVGAFSARAGLITVVLFGVEHRLWLAGAMAGAAYTLLLHRTKRLWPCIMAHGTTNAALGLHVLLTGEWKWW
jgi:CAAX prenyl protease-like protein